MATAETDDLDFAPEDTADAWQEEAAPPWKILIVDDEPSVHAATRLALGSVIFRGRQLRFFSAYNGAEALDFLHAHEDVAVIFLDVVMETEDAGLRVARRLREDGFTLPRVILRTGHPGYAPENEVIVDYDIHDYKEKTNLDFTKLFSSVISALRSYDDLIKIEQHRRGLLLVLESVSWFDLRSLRRYLARMLAELAVLADLDIVGVTLAVRERSRHHDSTDFDILVDGARDATEAAAARAQVAASLTAGCGMSGAGGAAYFARAHGMEIVIHTPQPGAFDMADHVLLDLFLAKVAQALDNHETFSEVLAERDAMVCGFALTECVGGCHHDVGELKAIQRLAQLTAAKLQSRLDFPDQIDDWFVFSIATASGFHDLGQEGLPHDIFEKTTPLTDTERAMIQQHVGSGLERMALRLAHLRGTRLLPMVREVIAQHHERHDGSGYPAGLRGDEIDLAARIVGLVDTYVAMTSPRAYRPAYLAADAAEFVARNRDRMFDARIVDAFLEVLADEQNPTVPD